MVGNFFEINEHATLEISKKMFNSKYNNSKEINFRVNNQNKFEGFHINNIIQIGEAFKTTIDSKAEEKAKYRGVLLVRDINNVPEEDKIVEKETAQKLLNMACSEFERAEIEKVWG